MVVSSPLFYISLLIFINLAKAIVLNNDELVGLFPPVFTPFYEDDRSLNLEVISKYAERLANNSIPGVLLSGTNGEGPACTLQERMQLMDVWLVACRRYGLQLMVQVAGQPYPDTLLLAEYAEQIGVGSILVLPELYYRPQTERELVDYMAAVAERAPNTPILYYDIDVSNVKLNMVKFFKLATDEIPNFVGLKCETSTGISILAFTQLRSYQRIFAGTQLDIASAFEQGLNGTISTITSLFPAMTSQIESAVKQERYKMAQDLQNKLNEIIAAITCDDEMNETSQTIAEMKAAMNLVSDVQVGMVRPPLPQLSSQAVQGIGQRLRNLGIRLNGE